MSPSASSHLVVGIRGPSLNFAESIETVQQNLREIQPTIFAAVPRIWERIHASIAIKGRDGTWFKRLWFGIGMKLARRIGDLRVANDGEHTARSRLLYAIGYPIVFRAIKERIGLRQSAMPPAARRRSRRGAA